MRTLKKSALLGLTISAIALSGCLSSSSSSDDPVAPAPQEPRTPHQQRIADGFFKVNEEKLAFAALPGFEDASRWTGIIDNAGYRVEVPANWNGELVMWAHGFRGEGPELTVDSPPMREYLLQNGYAWAASSYSANFYDVRAGVEDTNKLALSFNEIAAANNQDLPEPTKYYITGVSMGGHVAGAAIEKETEDTANNFVPYAGAAPMCGVMGDTALFDYFTAYSLALYQLGGVGADSFPVSEADAEQKLATARQALWTNYAANKNANGLTQQGGTLFAVLQNLSGGPRPVYPLSFGSFQDLLQGFAGSDGTITGVLNKSVVDTRDVTYRFTTVNGQPLTTAEQNFNNTIVQAEPDEGANALRRDGLRLIPKINGDLYADIPVVTVHTTGDLFVPISMQQIYRQRIEENGWGNNLVQRAVRAPGHCDFSLQEFNETFDAMIQWEKNGTKPAGDDLLNPAVVASDTFGCQFTRDGAPQTTTRAAIGQALTPCPAN